MSENTETTENTRPRRRADPLILQTQIRLDEDGTDLPEDEWYFEQTEEQPPAHVTVERDAWAWVTAMIEGGHMVGGVYRWIVAKRPKAIYVSRVVKRSSV